MKQWIPFFIVIIPMFVAGGCAHKKPVFNQAYISSVVVGVPVKRIELTAIAGNKIASKKGYPLFLYWTEEDKLLFSILNKDRQKSLYSFLITPSNSQIRQLSNTEKQVLLSKLKRKIIDDKTGNSVLDFLGFALQATVALAGGSSGSSSGRTTHYLGKIENNGYVLDVDARVTRGKWSIFQSEYDCTYKITNRQTGDIREGTLLIKKQGKKKESLENWLKSWRVSTDGQSYFYTIGKTVFITGSETRSGDAQILIDNYSYAELDISPRWDQIALLVIKEDEITKKIRYWIEFYPLKKIIDE